MDTDKSLLTPPSDPASDKPCSANLWNKRKHIFTAHSVPKCLSVFSQVWLFLWGLHCLKQAHKSDKCYLKSMSTYVCVNVRVPSKLLCLLQSHNIVWNGSATFCWGATWGQNASLFHINLFNIMTLIELTQGTAKFSLITVMTHSGKTACKLTLLLCPATSQHDCAFS